MDLTKQKRAVSTATSRSIVTRSLAAAAIKVETGKFTFSKRKAESPMEMLNKKTVFKDLTNREVAPSYNKFQDDKVLDATEKLAKAKISDKPGQKKVTAKLRPAKGQTKAESSLTSYFRVTKVARDNAQGKVPKLQKTEVAKVKPEVRKLQVSAPVPVPAPLKKLGVSEVVVPENKAPSIPAAQRDSVSSRDSVSPLYVTALENIEESENTAPDPNAEIDPTIPLKRILPLGVTDFDAENWCDPFQVSNYATDIFNYFKTVELNFKIPDYMHLQHELTTGMRTVVVDWMVELQENFELNHETLYLAVKLLDSYLSKVQVKKNNLQLVAAASLFIASKYDERFPPSVEDNLYVCEGAYNKNQLLSMEISILKHLDFKLGFPLSYRFLRRYARFGKIHMSTLTLARYILEYSLMDYSLVSHSDSKLAAAALLLALKMENCDWSPNLQYASGYDLDELKETTTRLNNMLNKALAYGTKLTAVRNKYSHKIFFEVAKRPLLKKLDF